MTRDEIIKIAREADMIDFRDDDSDPHVKQMIDFLEVVIERAVAAEREDIAKHFERAQGIQPTHKKKLKHKKILKLAEKAGIVLSPAQFSGVLETETDEYSLARFAKLAIEAARGIKPVQKEQTDGR